jgi:hypothetical protein
MRDMDTRPDLPESPAQRVRVRRAGDLAVGLAVSGYLMAAIVGLPLFEDGSYYLFVIATEHAPELPNLRFSAVLPQLPAVAAFNLGADLELGRSIFSMAYGAIPLLSLAACWGLLRSRAPALLLPVLPSFVALQLNFSGVSELLTALYLTWPVLLAMLLLPGRRWVLAMAVASGPLLLLLHPLAFVFCFGLGLVAWRLAGQPNAALASPMRLAWRRIALWLAAQGVLRLLWTSVGLNAYERGRLNPPSALNYVLGETPAQHLLVVLLMLTTLLALWTLHRGRHRAQRSRWLVVTLWLALLTSVWVSGEFVLGRGIVLKSAVTVAVGLFGMLAVVLLLLGRAATPTAIQSRMLRKAVRLAGVGLLILLVAKASAWHTGVRGIQDIVASADEACIRFDVDEPYSLQWPWMAIIDDWSAPVTALVTRPFVPAPNGIGSQPVAVMLKRDGCKLYEATGEAHLPADTRISFARLDAAFGPLRPPSH